MINSKSVPVIGFRYEPGQWDRIVLRTFEPVYHRPEAAQETGTQLFLAKDGYVVTGILLDADDTSSVAARIHFTRLKDGALVPADTYESDWIGTPSHVHQQELLAGPSQAVLGIYGRKGLNLDALGLIVGPLPGAAARP